MQRRRAPLSVMSSGAVRHLFVLQSAARRSAVRSSGELLAGVHNLVAPHRAAGAASAARASAVSGR
jgi:hypothetical protein